MTEHFNFEYYLQVKELLFRVVFEMFKMHNVLVISKKQL